MSISINFEVTATLSGKRITDNNGDLAGIVFKHIDDAIDASINIDIDPIFSGLVSEIRSNLLNDTFNDIAENRSDRRGDHYITGELYSSVDAVADLVPGHWLDIEVGYFENYGLNLELGTDFTQDYPIIMPLWEQHKEAISDNIQSAVLRKFASDFD